MALVEREPSAVARPRGGILRMRSVKQMLGGTAAIGRLPKKTSRDCPVGAERHDAAVGAQHRAMIGPLVRETHQGAGPKIVAPQIVCPSFDFDNDALAVGQKSRMR